MNIAQILKEKSRQSGAPLWVVEKDYSLSYLLAGIAVVSELDNRVVLKGGTALSLSKRQ
jgi:predicted nucleotidyltransferase component of viral defense system